MKLPLDESILEQHQQKYENSCVPMGIELVLKLTGAVDVDFYELQDEKGNVSRWGGDYDGTTVANVHLQMEYNLPRDPNFPLQDLFSKIKSELDSGRFVNCAWKENAWPNFHAYVIYGYTEEEFLAITKDHNRPKVEYIDNMKTRLTNIQGSDIITFSPK